MAFSDLVSAIDSVVRSRVGRADVVYTSAVGVSVTVSGVFDDTMSRVDLGQPGVNAPGPEVFLSLVDLPSDPVTDTSATVRVGGVTYVAHEAVKDGLGGVLLRLHRGA